MTIEPNTEWFHRETLTVVTVDSTPDGFVLLQPEIGGLLGEEPDDFLRDYATNVPVTQFLLDNMGAIAVGKYWHSFAAADGEVRICVSSASLEFIQSGQMVKLPLPTTLRDLLNTLRVMGVNAEIPQEVGA